MKLIAGLAALGLAVLLAGTIGNAGSGSGNEASARSAAIVFDVVPVEFLAGEPGEHEFTCQMGMLWGRIVVEVA